MGYEVLHINFRKDREEGKRKLYTISITLDDIHIKATGWEIGKTLREGFEKLEKQVEKK